MESRIHLNTMVPVSSLSRGVTFPMFSKLLVGLPENHLFAGAAFFFSFVYGGTSVWIGWTRAFGH